MKLKDRAADHMRKGMGTWTAFFGMLTFMIGWMIYNGTHGFDPYPWVLLNLFLSTLAGLQGVILLIAAKRSDELSDKTIKHIKNVVDKIDRNDQHIDRQLKEIKRLVDGN